MCGNNPGQWRRMKCRCKQGLMQVKEDTITQAEVAVKLQGVMATSTMKQTRVMEVLQKES